LSGEVVKRIVRAAPEALMKVPTNSVRLPAGALVDCVFMALPRRRPLAESIRLHRLIFHHLHDGPSVGAEYEASHLPLPITHQCLHPDARCYESRPPGTRKSALRLDL